MFRKLSDKVIGRKDMISVSETPKKNGSVLYSLSVSEESDREEIIFRCRISSRSLIHRIQNDVIHNNNVCCANNDSNEKKKISMIGGKSFERKIKRVI